VQIGRQNDIYVFCVSAAHCVAAEGKYIAFVSTVCQTEAADMKQVAESELKAGLKLLGKVDAYFFDSYEIKHPKGDGAADGCYISKS